MASTASPLLERRIENYAKWCYKNKHFVSYVSGAEYGTIRRTAKSGDIRKHDFVQSLKDKLAPFGRLGDKFDSSSIGYCAETVSANRVLQIRPTRLDQLSIGRVIRPKTQQFGKKCRICNSIF
jgi:hypothetical protein